MPVKISSPRPPPPIRNAIGAVPTLTAIAVRTPANITNSAFGSSTRRRIALGLIPMPRAASMRCSGTARMPSYVLRMIGSSVAIHSPTIAGNAPMPRKLIISASLPSVGNRRRHVDCLNRRLPPQRAIQGRDSQMPMRDAGDDRQAIPDTPTSNRCCLVQVHDVLA